MKYFFPHQLFGKKEAYTKEIRKASLERLAHLIKVCSVLMQTKFLPILEQEIKNIGIYGD
jgi:hypothetical protein